MDIAHKIFISKSQILSAWDIYTKERTVLLWSGGRDSTALLYILKQMTNSKELRVLFTDSGYEFPEVYQFIDVLARKWKIRLLKRQFLSTSTRELVNSNAAQKILIRSFQNDLFKMMRGFQEAENCQIFLSGTRWYEHFHRSTSYNESLRDVNFSYPILHWTEKDIVSFTKTERIPVLSLYSQGYKHLENTLFSSRNEKK